MKLCITGGSGFLGTRLTAMAASIGWQVLSLGGSTLPSADHPQVLARRADLSKQGAMTRIVEQWRPDAVANLAARARPEDCERAPALARLLNVSLPQEAARACLEHGATLVHVSTDMVFDGLAPPYEESAPPRPVSEYGRQKAEAETLVLQAMAGAPQNLCVCRLALLYGPSATPERGGFFQTMADALRQGAELRLFSDEYRTPLFVDDAARGILLAIEKGQGLLHLAGGQRVSRLEFGRLLARLMGDAEPYGATRIRAITQAEADLQAPRPPDVSLDIGKARTLGFEPLSLQEGLRLSIAAMR